MGFPEAFVVCLLGGWFTVSVLGQIRIPGIQRLRSWDVLGLVPMWWFFAPTPPHGDISLLYRDQLLDGTFTDWTEIRVGGRRRWWCFVWNPGRRERKAFLDIASTLAADAMEVSHTAVQLSLSYLALLSFVSAQPRTEASVATQFLVMITDAIEGDEDPAPAVLSHMHRLLPVDTE